MKELRKIQTTSNNLLNWVLQGKDCNRELPYYTQNMIFDHLIESYNVIGTEDTDAAVEIKEINDKDYVSYNPIKKIRRLVESKKFLFSYFMIHGSFGDLKLAKDWSDFDAMAVVKSEALNPNNRLILLETCDKIDKLMRGIDPYQHHGVHFIHEYEAAAYPNLYMPINLFNKSKCLLGNTSFPYKRVDSKTYELRRIKGIFKTLIAAGQTGKLKHHARLGIYLEEDYKNIYTMYQMKYFLCVVMLLPTLWLNSIDDYCEKKDSFIKIKKYFSQKELELIDKASSIRQTWGYEYQGNINKNEIPLWLTKRLGLNYLKRGEALAKKFERVLNERLQDSN